jgi:hypothetical protein
VCTPPGDSVSRAPFENRVVRLNAVVLDSAISWTGCLVIDTAVFILLLYKTIRVGRGVRILDTIMRNGRSPLHTSGFLCEFVELTDRFSSYHILLVRMSLHVQANLTQKLHQDPVSCESEQHPNTAGTSSIAFFLIQATY